MRAFTSNTPLAIYAVWHPACREAAPLASEIYRWFHASSGDLLRSGMGIPVFFRSQPMHAGVATPRPIEIGEADLNVVVVLADAEMVSSPAWRDYLDSIARTELRALVTPVALHPSAYRLPESLRRLNFLRVDERDDPPAGTAATTARRVSRLLRQLSEIIGRQVAAMLASPTASDAPARPPPPLTIFLSHAKRDGVEVAAALRSGIQDHGRLRAFFDDSDLPVGHSFASELEHAAAAGSVAMIAIVSDAYAARPWCRREVTLARTPCEDPEHPRCWSIQPLLAVDALAGAPTRSIPELGNATLIRWTPEATMEIVDLLMLEVLLAGYHRLRARRVPRAPGRHAISWTPDLPTVLMLQRAAKTPIAEICHPGHGLPESDARTLRNAFPAVRVRTFEAVEEPAPPGPPLNGQPIGLSSGFNDELGALGLGREHLEEATVRIGRCIVESGGAIAFGGMLRSSGLAETLLTLARTLTTDEDSPAAGATPAARVLSYQRWPALPDSAQIGADAGICEYVSIAHGPADERLEYDPRIRSPERARQLAFALSEMRRAMTKGGCTTSAGRPAPPLAASIVVGGLRTDFNGFMPGIFEEALYALEAGIPVYVVGGFGGAGGLLAKALTGASPPPELQAEFHRQHSARVALLMTGLKAHEEEDVLDRLFDRLNAQLARVRANLAVGLGNGLDAGQNARLMETDHVAEVIGLLRLGLTTRFGSTAR
jgi:hypothetical protein